ncbi:MAG: hypothetical protein KDC14_03945, partial [Planctomycetes bacterium]|nr:hypothetical protein [Planctomycetota bacterium]
GTELVGRVLSVATGKLNWSQDPHALKLAVVAGNESADQDSVVSFRDACAAAIKNGIMVNSIYCGNPADAEAPLWKEVSMRADGHFATIDHQNGTLAIDTPFDEQLVALTGSVNPTYLPFGENGQTAWVNQTAQDVNAINMNNDAAANRAMCKNGALYVCGWDLVDASKQEGFDLAAIPDEQLPEDMRAMTLEERQAHIDATARKRAEIQQQIAEVGAQRQVWLQAEMQRLALDESNSFDHQLRTAIRTQVSQKGFEFPAPAVVPHVESTPQVEGAAPQAAPATGNARVPVAPQQGGVQSSRLPQQTIVPASTQATHGAATNNAAPTLAPPQAPEAAPEGEEVQQVEEVQQAEAIQPIGLLDC